MAGAASNFAQRRPGRFAEIRAGTERTCLRAPSCVCVCLSFACLSSLASVTSPTTSTYCDRQLDRSGREKGSSQEGRGRRVLSRSRFFWMPSTSKSLPFFSRPLSLTLFLSPSLSAPPPIPNHPLISQRLPSHASPRRLRRRGPRRPPRGRRADELRGARSGRGRDGEARPARREDGRRGGQEGEAARGATR